MANWDATLSNVEQSIEDCLATLDRYEAAFAKVLTEHGAELPPRQEPPWDVTLSKATAASQEMEDLLAEQETVWRRWRETLSAWHGLIEQPA